MQNKLFAVLAALLVAGAVATAARPVEPFKPAAFAKPAEPTFDRAGQPEEPARPDAYVYVGSGTQTQRQPLGMNLGYERSAALYLQSEIGTTGLLDAIAWNITALNNAATANVKIYVRTITATQLVATTWASLTSGATLVYDATPALAVGWQVFPFTSTFNYTGDNLLVLVETNYGGAGGENPNAKRVTYSTTASYLHEVWAANTTPPAGNGTVNYNRPNVRLTLTPQYDLFAARIDSVRRIVLPGGTTRVGATVTNGGYAPCPAGVPVVLQVTSPAAAYYDTVLTAQAIDPGASLGVVFSPDWATPGRGVHSFRAWTALSGDNWPGNDTCPEYISETPYGLYESFNSWGFPPENWDTVRIAGIGRAPLFDRVTDSALAYTRPGVCRFRSYYLDAGTKGALRTPRLDLTAHPDDSLSFYLLHPTYLGRADDSLEVQISTDLGATWATLAVYTGEQAAHGRKVIDLETVGQNDSCHIRFIGHSQFNHNIYFDDVIGPPLYRPLYDASLRHAWVTTYPLAAFEADTIACWVRNDGRLSANSFVVLLLRDGISTNSVVVPNLAPGESLRVAFRVAAGPGRTRTRFTFRAILAGDEEPRNDSLGFEEWVFPAGTHKAMGFERRQLGTGWPPAGWDTLNLDGERECWDRYTGEGFGHTGIDFAACRFESSGTRNNDWLITDAFTPAEGRADSLGFYWRSFIAIRESLEVWAMGGQSPADTIARLFAAGTSAGEYLEVVLPLDAWDGTPVYIGFHYPSEDQFLLFVDDVWWQRELPPWGPPGWHPRAQLPATERRVKDGAWLAYDRASNRVYAAKGYKSSTFLAYEVETDAWTARADWPDGVEAKKPGKGAAGCADPTGGHGLVYAVKGNNTSGFWRYDPSSNEWTQLAPVPLGPSNKKVKGGSGLALVARPGETPRVYCLKGYRSEFWEYRPEGDTWLALPDAPVGALPKWDNGSWLAWDGGGRLYAHKAKKHEFYAYDIETGAWGPALRGMPLVSRSGRSKKSKDGGSGACVEGTIYALKGGNTQEFWAYDIARDTWAEMDTMPQQAPGSYKRKRVKGGGALIALPPAWPGGQANLPALKGNGTDEFWFYTTELPGAPGARARGDTVAAAPAAAGPGWAIAPNPLCGGVATLRWNAGLDPLARPCRVRIVDIAGREALPPLRLPPGGSGALRLDLAALPAGVYVVRLEGGRAALSRKLVIER